MTGPVADRSFVIAGVAALLLVPAALAQSQPEVVQRLERQLREYDLEYRLAIPLDAPISERLLLDYGGTYRFGFYSIDDALGHTRILRQNDLRLYLRAELDGAHRFFGRLRFVYDDWNSGDSFDGRGDEFENPIGDRYWYQFDLRGAVLSSAGLVLLVTGILAADTNLWLTAGLMVLGALVILWFLRSARAMERAGQEPLLSPELFRNRTSNLGLATQNLQWLLLMGTSFTVAAYLQVVRGYDAIETGVIFTAATLGLLVSSLAAERLASPAPVSSTTVIPTMHAARVLQ